MFTLDAVEEFLASCGVEPRFGPDDRQQDLERGNRYPPYQLARLIGVCEASIHRYWREGFGSVAADRIAIAVDGHPAIIWPESYDA